MKKFVIYLFAIATIVATGFASNACSKDDDEKESSKKENVSDNAGGNLVGSWYSAAEGIWIIFKANGTGSLDGEYFEWDSEGSTVYLDFEDQSASCYYSISGNKLKIAIDGETITFVKS